MKNKGTKKIEEIKINRKGSQVVEGMNNNHLIYLSTKVSLFFLLD